MNRIRYTLCRRRAAVFVVALLAVIPSAARERLVMAEDQPNRAAQIGRDEADDDPLPEQAAARLGTLRFRQEGEVKQLRYFDGGKRMASLNRDAVIIWDANTGRSLRQLRCDLPNSTQSLIGMDVSPDGTELAAGVEQQIYVWDVETGEERISFPIRSDFGPSEDLEMCYSPDGEQLAVAVGLNVLLFEAARGGLTRSLTIANHRAVFYSLCWSPDGDHLSASTLDPAVVTWIVASGEVVRRFAADKEQSFSRATSMSADGKLLLAATGGDIDLWQFDTGEHWKRIKTDADFIHALALSSDNEVLVAGAQDGKIRVLNANTGALLRAIDGRLWLGRDFAVSPDFQTVALGAVFPTLRQWDILSGEELFPELTSFGHDAAVQCAAYSPDGRLIASGGPNKQLCLWDAETGELRVKLPTPSSVNNLAFTPNGAYLLTSWESSPLVRVWNVATEQLVQTLDSGAKRVKAFAPTPDGRRLIVVVSDSRGIWHSPIGQEKIQVWDLETNEKLREFSFSTSSTESLALTADGKSLVTGAANGVIHVFDLESQKEQATLTDHSSAVDSLAVSSDGRWLAAGSRDQTISVWETAAWKKQRVLKGHDRPVTSVAFLPNTHMLASGEGKVSYPVDTNEPQRIRLWDADAGEEIGTLTGHQSNTSAVAFAPDDRRLVSAHDNTTLMIWDVKSMVRR